MLAVAQTLLGVTQLRLGFVQLQLRSARWALQKQLAKEIAAGKF